MIDSSWDIECGRLKLVIMGHFLPKKSEFWKNEKSIWKCHQFTHVYQKLQLYDVCFLSYGVQQTFFCHFGLYLSLLPDYWPPQKIGKNVKTPIIILHMYQNKDHMYVSWDRRPGRQSFLSFEAIFCPLTFLTTQKNKILKKWKNTWRY